MGFVQWCFWIQNPSTETSSQNELTFGGKGGVTDSYVCAGTQQDQQQSFHIAFGVAKYKCYLLPTPATGEQQGRQQADEGKQQGDNRETTGRQQGDSRETAGSQRETTRRQQGNKRDTKGKQRETTGKQKGDKGRQRETKGNKRETTGRRREAKGNKRETKGNKGKPKAQGCLTCAAGSERVDSRGGGQDAGQELARKMGSSVWQAGHPGRWVPCPKGRARQCHSGISWLWNLGSWGPESKTVFGFRFRDQKWSCFLGSLILS